MKRKLTFLMVAVLLVTLMASGLTAQAQEAVQFEYFLDWSALPGTWDLNQPIFAAITEATGCAPTINKPAEDAGTKLNLMMASNTMPDLITIGNTDLVREMIDSGLIWDMEELLTTYVPDSHLLTAFPEDVKEALIARDGGWYAYPSHINSADAEALYGVPGVLKDYLDSLKYSNQFSIYFRSEHLDAIGVDVATITTEEKLMELLAQLDAAGLTNDSGASVYTLMIQGNNFEPYTFDALKMHFGVIPVDAEGNYQSYYYDDEFRHAAQLLNQCAQLGYFDENELTMDEPTFVALCNSDRVACFIGGLAALQVGNDTKWVTPGPITSSTGATPVFGLNTTVGAGWLSTVVSKTTKHPEEIAKFIDFMSSRDGMLLHMYGIEGTEYTWDENKLLHRSDDAIAHMEDSITGLYGFYGFHNTSFSRTVEYVDVENVNNVMTSFGASDLVYKYNASLLNLPSGYVSPNSEEAFIKTEVDTYAKSKLAELLLAPSDDAFDTLYDDFITQLDALGLPKYDAYLNKAVQANYEKAGETLQDIN